MTNDDETEKPAVEKPSAAILPFIQRARARDRPPGAEPTIELPAALFEQFASDYRNALRAYVECAGHLLGHPAVHIEKREELETSRAHAAAASDAVSVILDAVAWLRT